MPSDELLRVVFLSIGAQQKIHAQLAERCILEGSKKQDFYFLSLKTLKNEIIEKHATRKEKGKKKSPIPYSQKKQKKLGSKNV